jgi:hypothetical protein
MSLTDPLPFRLRVPGIDALDSQGVRSISYRVEGLLHLDGDTISLQWAATRNSQWVTFSGVTDEVDRSPIGRLEVPANAIASVRFRAWWTPRLELQGRSLEVFEGIPSARLGVLRLKIRRRDREQASAMAAAIDRARRLPELGAADSMTPPSL